MRPILRDLAASTLASIRLSLGLVSSTRRTLIESISNSFVGVIYLLYVYVDNVFSDFFPQDANENRLLKWGEAINLPRKAASFAVLEIKMTGIIGAIVSEGTQLRSSTGRIYEVVEDTEFATAEQLANINAILPGTESNLGVGETITFINSQNNIQIRAEITTVVNEAEDIETIERYRNRVLQFLSRTQYRAGSISDYISWATEVPGIARAYVATRYDGIINRLAVFILKGTVERIPSQGEIDEVLAYINARRPVTADISVFAPTEVSIDMEISIRRNTEDVQRSVTANLNQLFLNDARPKGTIGVNGQINTGIIYISHIREAVSLAIGEEDSIININTNLLPENNYEILTLGNIEFKTLIS